MLLCKCLLYLQELIRLKRNRLMLRTSKESSELQDVPLLSVDKPVSVPPANGFNPVDPNN